jgi:hypothetical protein
MIAVFLFSSGGREYYLTTSRICAHIDYCSYLEHLHINVVTLAAAFPAP